MLQLRSIKFKLNVHYIAPNPLFSPNNPFSIINFFVYTSLFCAIYLFITDSKSDEDPNCGCWSLEKGDQCYSILTTGFSTQNAKITSARVADEATASELFATKEEQPTASSRSPYASPGNRDFLPAN